MNHQRTKIFGKKTTEVEMNRVLMKKLYAVCMCIVLSIAAVSAEGVTEIQAPTPSQLPKAESMVIDPINYHKQVIQGYYTFDCPVTKDITRSAKFYIPEESGFNQPTVFVLIPEQENSYQFLVKSGWKAMADGYKLNIVLVEPADGVWKSNKEEIQYLNALREDVSYRPFFSTFTSNFYAVAYSEKASSILLENSMRAPANWAGVVLAGTSGVSTDLIAEMKATPSKVPGISMAQVLQPIWIVSSKKTDAVQNLIRYYKEANHSEYASTSTSFADEAYYPQRGGTDDNEWCANVFFSEKAWEDCVTVEFAQSAYDNLLQGVYRYPGDSNGALRQNDNIYYRGFKKFNGMVPGGFKADKSDQYNREWFVYVPRSVDTAKPAPLVFVFHGAGGSGDEIGDRSGWASVAEEKGFIIVCPTGSHVTTVRNVSNITTSELMRAMWNTQYSATETRPNDLLFVEYLYDWMQKNYNIDVSRVYASGQSSGGMMTWATAMYLPEIFTAVAPISANGTMGESNQAPSTSLVPIFAFIGELDGSFRGGFGSDAARATVDYWTTRYNTVENWASYSYMEAGKKASYVTDNFINYVFSTQQGNPIIRLVEVLTKTHAILPSECYMAWNECFSKYTKDKATGNLYYNGELVK